MSAGKPPSALRNSIGGLAPKLVDLTEDVLFGEVWERPQLSKRDRSLITCAALVATGKTEQMEFHFPNAIRNGVTGRARCWSLLMLWCCLRGGRHDHLEGPDPKRYDRRDRRVGGGVCVGSRVPAREFGTRRRPITCI